MRIGSTEISGNVPKTTQLLHGVTERSGDLSPITQLTMLKPREIANLPKMTELTSGGTVSLGKFAYDHTGPRWKKRVSATCL